MTDTDIALVRALNGTTCICGDSKQAAMSHCRDCYYALSTEQRRALYRRVGSGYAEAYSASVATLRAKGRVKVREARP